LAGCGSARLGGRKGGEAVRDKYGPTFYEEIGRKGAQKARELIEQGKRMARDAQRKEGGLDQMGNLKGSRRDED
jgi:general stress protein YciG